MAIRRIFETPDPVLRQVHGRPHLGPQRVPVARARGSKVRHGDGDMVQASDHAPVLAARPRKGKRRAVNASFTPMRESHPEGPTPRESP